jgi:hypothetical protein
MRGGGAFKWSFEGIDFFFLRHGVTICDIFVSRRCYPRGRCSIEAARFDHIPQLDISQHRNDFAIWDSAWGVNVEPYTIV